MKARPAAGPVRHGGGAERSTAALRVVHVITTLTTGGAERQVELLAAHSRHDERVVALYTGGLVADSIRERGIPVHVLGMRGWRKAAAVPRLARVLRSLAPDVVHVHLLSGQLWGVPAARLAGVPVVVSTEHSIMEATIEGRPKTRSLRRVYLALDALTTHTVAVSPETVDRLRAWGIPGTERMTVVNPPIDFESLAVSGHRGRVRRSLGMPEDVCVIGAVGRLDAVKRLDVLLRGAAEHLRAGSHLVIVGDGPLRARLHELAAALGVADRVHLTGPRPDVAQLLAAFDVLISPSRDETFGMAVVEALGAGLPVAYAQAPALDGLGLEGASVRRLTATSDEAAAAEIDVVLGDLLAAGRPGRSATAELVTRYDASRTAAAIDDLYVALVAAHGSGRHRA